MKTYRTTIMKGKQSMGATQGSLTELRELKTEIAGLRTDLKRFIERANQQHVEGVLGDLKKNYRRPVRRSPGRDRKG